MVSSDKIGIEQKYKPMNAGFGAKKLGIYPEFMAIQKCEKRWHSIGIEATLLQKQPISSSNKHSR